MDECTLSVDISLLVLSSTPSGSDGGSRRTASSGILSSSSSDEWSGKEEHGVFGGFTGKASLCACVKGEW